ncbi:MAG TPA: hypothetical protein VMU99_02225 [Acidimicrobiales bacterium]|nr:hypothetical protein [Acidimicrobiales bacterium]
MSKIDLRNLHPRSHPVREERILAVVHKWFGHPADPDPLNATVAAMLATEEQ